MEIKTIAIVGATSLGRTIALVTARAGYRTILEDVSLSALEQGTAWIAQALGEAVAARQMDSAVRDAVLVNLIAATTPEDASHEADLIIEAVADEMEMKIELFTIFDKFAKPGAIFREYEHFAFHHGHGKCDVLSGAMHRDAFHYRRKERKPSRTSEGKRDVRRNHRRVPRSHRAHGPESFCAARRARFLRKRNQLDLAS